MIVNLKIAFAKFGARSDSTAGVFVIKYTHKFAAKRGLVMGSFFAKLGKTVLTLIILAVVLMYLVPVGESHYLKYIKMPGEYDNCKRATNWMSKLDGNLKLNEINIPGTHDSATTYVELPLMANCQTLTIKEQLEAGFRYLDIRLSVETDTDTGEKRMKLMHGFTSCKKSPWPWAGNLYLEDVLNDCYDFLAENPDETILFAVKQEHGDDAVEDFQKLLDEYVKKDIDEWLLTRTFPTLDEARGKIVLMRRYEDEAKLSDDAGIMIYWNNQDGSTPSDIPVEENKLYKTTVWVQDRYEYWTDAKWNAFYYGYANPALEDENAAFINFLSTKGGLYAGHPFYFAFRLNRKFKDSSFEIGYNYGWTILDFGTPELAKRVYSANE